MVIQEDSVLLWKAVCSNKLLANVDLVLFLNKCDILEAKLNSGIRLSKYVRSYSDRSNDIDTASKCMCSRYIPCIHVTYRHVQILGASSVQSTESTLLYHGNFMVSALLSRYGTLAIRGTIQPTLNHLSGYHDYCWHTCKW